jgi:hypothetical protein
VAVVAGGGSVVTVVAGDASTWTVAVGIVGADAVSGAGIDVSCRGGGGGWSPQASDSTDIALTRQRTALTTHGSTVEIRRAILPALVDW